MGDSENRSQVVELRRSSRLRDLAKSATSMSQNTETGPSRKRRKPDNPKTKTKILPYRRGVFFVRGGYSEIPNFHRRQRDYEGAFFRCAYEDKRSDGWDKITEQKLIVLAGGEKIHHHVFPNVGGSHGITWTGVHGIKSICAVYFSKNPGRKCIVDWLRKAPLKSYFTDFVISEMEDVADSCLNLENVLKKPVCADSSPYPDKTLKPFAVVSVPDTSNADEKSCQEASAPSLEAQEKAIAHLQMKMIDLPAYHNERTQLVAISAFQRLWGRELNAEEITVCCLFKEAGCHDYYIRNLSRAQVEVYLEFIKKMDLEKGIVY